MSTVGAAVRDFHAANYRRFYIPFFAVLIAVAGCETLDPDDATEPVDESAAQQVDEQSAADKSGDEAPDDPVPSYSESSDYHAKKKKREQEKNDEDKKELPNDNKPKYTVKVTYPVLAASVDPPKTCGIDLPKAASVGTYVPWCSITEADPILDEGVKLGSKAAWQPWMSGSTIALSGKSVVVADRDNGDVVSLNGSTLKTLGKTQVGGQPRRLVAGPTGRIFATLFGSGEVVRLQASDSAAAKLNARWKVGVGPLGIALHAKTNRVFVALNGDDRLVGLDAKTGKQQFTVATHRAPRALATNGKILVVGHLDGTAKRYTLGGKLVGNAGSGMANDLSSCFGATSGPVQRVHIEHIAIDNAGRFALIHQVARPGDPAVAPWRARLPEEKQSASFFNPPPYYGATGLQGCRPLAAGVGWLSSLGNSTVSSLKIAGKASEWLLGQHQPVAASFHPTHDLAFVAMAGSDTVAVLRMKDADGGGEAGTVASSIVGQLPTEAYPAGLAVSADGRWVYVHAAHGYAVERFDLQAKAILVKEKGTPRKACPDAGVVFAKPTLSAKAAAGRTLFHRAGNTAMSFQGDLTCAGCHPDGGDDGLLWVGRTGSRQTPVLSDRLKGTAPFNWAGTAPSLQHNMQLTVERMGGKGLCKEELAWLEAFMLEGLPEPTNPHRSPKGLTKQQAKGKAIFESPKAACTGCHTPDSFTNGQRYDVKTANGYDESVAKKLADRKRSLMLNAGATLDELPDPMALIADILKLDTPSLKGLWRSGPYLHDGSAATLMDVLEKTATTMGHTAHLSKEDKEALVAYLLTL